MPKSRGRKRKSESKTRPHQRPRQTVDTWTPTYVLPAPDLPEFVFGSIFGESRLKVSRARRHIGEADLVAKEFIEVHKDKMGMQLDPASGAYYLAANLPRPIQLDLAVSDAIRCLRSALDYLVSSLARAAGLGDERTLFPFHETRKNVEDMFRPKVERVGKKDIPPGTLFDVGTAYPDLKEIILRDIQPYSVDDGASAMGDLLWRLITMDNVDKHRLIMPIIRPVNIASTYGGSSLNITVVNAGPVPLIVSTEPIKSQPQNKATIEVVFPQKTRLSGKPVIGTLTEGANLVADVVEIFETHFQGKNARPA